MRSSFDHLETRCLQVGRTVADHYLEFTRLDHETVLAVPEAEVLRRQREFNALLLSRAQRDAPESFQLLDRPGDAGRDIAEVELHDLVAGAPAGVLDLDAGGNALVRANAGSAQ